MPKAKQSKAHKEREREDNREKEKERERGREGGRYMYVCMYVYIYIYKCMVGTLCAPRCTTSSKLFGHGMWWLSFAKLVVVAWRRRLWFSLRHSCNLSFHGAAGFTVGVW